MLTTIFLCSTVVLSIMFMFMSHPLAMGLMLLLQTLVIAVSAGLPLTSFWFSYILFLVFLGGMLVLFIYVASLASNEMFTMSAKIVVTAAIASWALMALFLLTDTAELKPLLEYIEQSSLTESTNLYNIFIMKMYNMLNYSITLLMILYLLLALIIVANIVTIQEGPLRPTT
uniref:NADH-ubiquinone oxidoreductase chain 6 n=1 Tax=Caenis pycnacantha TaxID=675576 RepID=X1W3D1_9INSE|nr:NADH dehydrogenase subunit 6 [Caenis pycnacantha]